MRANGSENCIGRVQPYLKSMCVKVSILSFQIRQIWEDEQFFLSKLPLKLQMYLLVEIIIIFNYLYESVTTFLYYINKIDIYLERLLHFIQFNFLPTYVLTSRDFKLFVNIVFNPFLNTSRHNTDSCHKEVSTGAATSQKLRGFTESEWLCISIKSTS